MYIVHWPARSLGLLENLLFDSAQARPDLNFVSGLFRGFGAKKQPTVIGPGSPGADLWAWFQPLRKAIRTTRPSLLATRDSLP